MLIFISTSTIKAKKEKNPTESKEYEEYVEELVGFFVLNNLSFLK
jgi:hypothetical protein